MKSLMQTGKELVVGITIAFLVPVTVYLGLQVLLPNPGYKNFEIEVKDGKIQTVKEIFLDAKLIDGTVVKVEGDSLAEGAKVVVVTAEGEIPAPDGVHELEDGTKVETKEGVIARIEEMG